MFFSNFRLRELLEYAGHSGFIIGFAALGIAYTTLIFYGMLFPDFTSLLVIFLMMFAVYRTNKIMDLKEDFFAYPERAKYIHGGRSYFEMILLPALLFIVATFIAYFLNIYAFGIIAFSSIWIYFYSVDLPKFIWRKIGYKKIKAIPYVKTVYSSIAWSLVVILVTLLAHHPITVTTLALAMLVFIRFSINTIAFDFKDLDSDRSAGIKTIPIIFGERFSQLFLHYLNVLAFVFVFYSVFQGFLPSSALGLNLIAFYDFYFISKLTEKSIDLKWFSDVVIDGAFLLWPFLAVFGHFLLT